MIDPIGQRMMRARLAGEMQRQEALDELRAIAISNSPDLVIWERECEDLTPLVQLLTSN